MPDKKKKGGKGILNEKMVARKWKKGEPSPNPEGRPSKGWSFAELIREFGDKQIPAKYRKDCAEICKDFGSTWKHGLVAMIYRYALEGSAQHAHYLLERIDGRAPLINISNTTEVNSVIVLPEIVESVVDQIETGRDILQLPPVNGNGVNGHNGYSDLSLEQR